MYKNIIYILIFVFFSLSAHSLYYQKNKIYENQTAINSKIRIDLLSGAAYYMWVCFNTEKECSSTLFIGNGTTIEVQKGDIFSVSIATFPRVCDFYKVTKNNDFSVISYWGSVFRPYFIIYGDDVIQYLKREYTFNIVSGCQGLQGVNE